MNNKLDIFEFLKNIDDNNITYINNLTDSQLKSIPVIVFTRWLSGTKNTKQLLLVNNILNRFVFSLDKHKKLLLYLMICCSNNRKNYRWYNKKTLNTNIKCEILSLYLNISLKEASNYIDFYSIDEIKQMGVELSVEKEKLNKIK